MQLSRRVPRAHLVAAVAPVPLTSVLESLRQGGMLAGYEERGDEVVVWGDLTALDCAFDVIAHHEEEPATAEPRADYYRAAASFTHDAEFRSLPVQTRAVWRLHAEGASNREVALRLGITLMTVRVAIRRARLAAGLPAVTSTMRRGGGRGRPPRPDSEKKRCADGCERHAVARGLCMAHYLRRWRSGKLAIACNARAA